MKTVYDVIKRPIVSEKSVALAEVANRYVFEVASQATKNEIRDAVQKIFSVRVKRVRTMMMHGKVKRLAKSVVKKSNWKKAIITLDEGQKIEIFQTQ